MIGRRFPDGEFITEPGGYSKHLIRRKDGGHDVGWMLQAPCGGGNFLIGAPNADGSAYHWVEEHDDGTITVQPFPADAPEDRRNSNSIETPKSDTRHYWHGYIYRGEWRHV